MSFQDIPKIEDPDFYLDVAFKRAKVKAELERQKKRNDRITKSKLVEEVKIEVIKESIDKQMTRILNKFPRIDELEEFYQELIKAFIDVGKLKKCLGSLNWVVMQTNKFSSAYIDKIRKTKELLDINKHRRAYYGRLSSLLKQVKKELAFIEEARKIIREFPVIKKKYKSVAIAGFPNVGKTTLLSKLTTSKPEIQSYAFTTKGINIGYVEREYDKVQVLDTPGSLNRFAKMNAIEKQASLALKLCCEKIIYVFDPTDTYPVEMQEELLEKIKELKKPIAVYLSKVDVADKERVDSFKKKYKLSSIDELKKFIQTS